MSYILDALRRADAERQRGGVPGLHDHTGVPGALGATPGQAPVAAGSRLLRWAGAALGLLLALAAAWWLGRGAAVPVPGVVPAQAPAAAVVTAVASAPRQLLAGAASLAPPLVSPQVTAAQPLQAPAIVPPRPPPAPTSPVVAPVQRPVTPAAPLGAPAGRQAPAARPAADAATAAAPAASDPVRAWSSLPESVRAQLPPLAWSGAVYAERPEQRLVVVNGQVAREGDTLAPGVQLLQIRPKSVLLRWLGQRVELPL
jgi:general secretion pathway protein B